MNYTIETGMLVIAASDPEPHCFNCGKKFYKNQRVKWYYCTNKKKLICRLCVIGKNRLPQCDYNDEGQLTESHAELIVKGFTSMAGDKKA